MKDIHEALVCAMNLAPQIVDVSPVECSVMITDRQTILMTHSSGNGVDLQSLVGKAVSSGGAAWEAIEKGKRICKILPEEMYGIPLMSTSVPIRDSERNIVGTLNMSVSLVVRQTMEQIAHNLSVSAQQMVATTQELAATASQVAGGMNELKTADAKVIEDIGNTGEILRFINEVAANSNLLGLNAAIEAARAGEHGRGFAVVAEEIRKMAVNSGESVKRIRDILAEIKDESIVIDKRINELLTLSERQASASQEIAAAIEEMTMAAQSVDESARSMFRE
jgi:regulator of RNase E activity RraB